MVNFCTVRSTPTTLPGAIERCKYFESISLLSKNHSDLSIWSFRPTHLLKSNIIHGAVNGFCMIPVVCFTYELPPFIGCYKHNLFTKERLNTSIIVTTDGLQIENQNDDTERMHL